MTKVARRALWIAAVAVVIVAGCVVAVARFWPHGPKGAAPDLVPASWAQYRETPDTSGTWAGKGRVPRLPRLRARRVQESGNGGLPELPRQGDGGRPSRQPVQFDRVPDLPRVRARARRADLHRLPRQPARKSACRGAARDGRLRERATACTRRRRSFPRLARAATTSGRRSTPSMRTRKPASTATAPTSLRPRPRPRARPATRRGRSRTRPLTTRASPATSPTTSPRATAHASAATAPRPRWSNATCPPIAVCLNCHAPHAPGEAASRLREVPPERPGESREGGCVRHLSRAPR